MHRWSYIRHALEQEHLAGSLRGRIQYDVTTYRKSHDREGKAAIRFDGRELIRGDYWHFTSSDRYAYTHADADRLNRGAFDQHSFYAAFSEFDNQSIEKSLASENLLVRIFAVLDRRVGKRRLLAMYKQMEHEPEVLQRFYQLRTEAEGIRLL